jgi:hypothetical protein
MIQYEFKLLMMPTRLTSVSIVKGVLDLPKTRMITCPKNCSMSSMMTPVKSITHTIEEHPTLQIEFTRSVDDFTTRKARNKISQITHNVYIQRAKTWLGGSKVSFENP